MAFKAHVIDRFPNEDYTDFPLPMDLMPMFAFPEGLKCVKRGPNRIKNAFLGMNVGFLDHPFDPPFWVDGT